MVLKTQPRTGRIGLSRLSNRYPTRGETEIWLSPFSPVSGSGSLPPVRDLSNPKLKRSCEKVTRLSVSGSPT